MGVCGLTSSSLPSPTLARILARACWMWRSAWAMLARQYPSASAVTPPLALRSVQEEVALRSRASICALHAASWCDRVDNSAVRCGQAEESSVASNERLFRQAVNSACSEDDDGVVSPLPLPLFCVKFGACNSSMKKQLDGWRQNQASTLIKSTTYLIHIVGGCDSLSFRRF